MTDSKKNDDGSMPSVFLTEEQWEFLKRSENERTRDQIRHNAEVREMLKAFSTLLPKPDPKSEKRDWFAGQALAGLLSCNETRGDGAERYPELCDVLAEASFGYADAMIAARKAGGA